MALVPTLGRNRRIRSSRPVLAAEQVRGQPRLCETVSKTAKCKCLHVCVYVCINFPMTKTYILVVFSFYKEIFDFGATKINQILLSKKLMRC